MLSEKLGHTLDKPLEKLIRISFLSRVHPTWLTVSGLMLNVVSAAFIILGHWRAAAFIIAAAGLCDMLDGATARVLNKTSRFGGFLDSVADRYSDMALITAFIIYYSAGAHLLMVSLCSVAAVGSMMVPYTRARAESFIDSCNIGLMERPERIILLAAGCYWNLVVPVFWILALLTHMTVLQRIYWTWKASRSNS
jgi:CDP-diacylglycerol---glycerol-3-phosphate 3-phosphatidyltransferase